MEPNVIKDAVESDDSAVGNCVESYQENSTEQRMDASKFIFITPHITRKHDEISGNDLVLTGLSRYSVDSGFSDQAFDSSWTSSSMSVSSSSELEGDSSRRLTLKAIEFSPINRGSDSNITGRRLKFGSCDLQPLPFQLPQTDSCVNTTDECSEEYLHNETDSFYSKSLPNITDSMCNYNSRSCSSSLCSLVTDDLEVSLQEMALEESLSPSMRSRSSPVQFSSDNCCCHHCHASEEEVSPQLGDVKEKVKTISQFVDGCRNCQLDKSAEVTYLPQAHRESRLPDVLDSITNYCISDAKMEFPHEFSLNSASSSESQMQRHDTITQQDSLKQSEFDYAGTASEKFPDNKITPQCYSSSSLSNCVVLPHNYTLPSIINQICKVNFATKGTAAHFPQRSFANSLKSQIKRSSDYEGECDFIFSPTKIRKTEVISNTHRVDRTTATIISPQKNASRKVSVAKGDISLVSDGDIKHVCVHRPDMTETFEEISIKELAKNSAFTPQLYPKNSICQIEITPTDTSNIVKENLQKIIAKFSPPQPTRLIGRNVGVKIIDIVCELYNQNLLLCLGKLFQHVSNADLLSVARVSTFWKLALFNDHKAYNRYRQHSRSLSKNNLQRVAGKENCGEKPIDALSVQPLTQPRSLLASVQSQANRGIVPVVPPVTTVKDVLMSDDMLRICPHCQGPAIIKHRQDRATCTNEKCFYDFCTLCFSSFHHPQLCKPLCKAPSRGDVAGTRKSKKNLRRL